VKQEENTVFPGSGMTDFRDHQRFLNGLADAVRPRYISPGRSPEKWPKSC
jgi:hypothetical protein